MIVGCVSHERLAFCSTENDPDRRIFAFVGPVFSGDSILRSGNLTLLEHGGFVPRKSASLIELAVYLTRKLAHGPSAAQCLLLVESAGFRLLYCSHNGVDGTR